MSIDNFEKNNTFQNCTGCFACAEACPTGCIDVKKDEDGFGYASIRENKCINCGKCNLVCPVITKNPNEEKQMLFSAVANDNSIRMRGSSGGVFEILANSLLKEGYYVCGAAFDENLKLKHKIISSYDELKPLLKSKYIQSDTEGIFSKIDKLLKNRRKVFFCGTPCQVSALKNYTFGHNDALVTADIICHGVPPQKMFDDYVALIEKECGGKVIDFSFRIKDNEYRHAHGFSYTYIKDGKNKSVQGVYTQSPYYNSFKNYQTFRESCYNCKYTTLERVSDITLGDFWGIEKFDKKANTDKGVSLLLINTEIGKQLLRNAEGITITEYPVKYGVDTNYCLTKTTKRPAVREKIYKEIASEGYKAAAENHFSGNSIKYKLYWKIPPFLRNLLRKLRGML